MKLLSTPQRLHDVVFWDGIKTLNLTEAARDFLVGSTSTTSDYYGLYSAVPLLYRAVNVIGDTVASLPLGLYKPGSDENLIDKEEYRFITRNLRQRLKRTVKSMLIFGRAYWLMEPVMRGKRAIQYRWVSPVSIQPYVDSNEGLSYFDRYVQMGSRNAGTMQRFARIYDKEGRELYVREGGNSRGIAPELYYFWEPSALHDVGWDVSPVQAAARVAGASSSVDAFVETFFGRGAVKGVLFTTERGVNPTKDQKDAFRREWEAVFNGIAGAFRTLIAGPLVPHVVGEGLEGLTNKALNEDQVEKLLGGMGVPKSVIVAGSANYASAHQEALNYVEYTIKPQTDLLLDEVNEQALDRFGVSLMAHYDQLEIYQKREMEKAASVVPLVKEGLIDADEGRELFGYAPRPAQEPETPEISQELLTRITVIHKELTDGKRKPNGAGDNAADRERGSNQGATRPAAA